METSHSIDSNKKLLSKAITTNKRKYLKITRINLKHKIKWNKIERNNSRVLN